MEPKQRRARVVPKKKPRGRHKQGTTSIQIKGHNENNPASTGHHERRQAMIKRALELKRMDNTHFEICVALQQEFNLERLPGVSTVADLLDAAYRATDAEIKQIQWQWRMEQFEQLERAKMKWFRLVTADEGDFKVRRIEGRGEDTAVILDENIIGEQIKANQEMVRIMARQARLFGLDLETAIKSEGEDVGNLQVWILNQINQMVGAPNGAPLEDGEIKLELTSGL